MRIVLACIVCLRSVMALWNSESMSNCDPADFSKEGDRYCVQRKDGWNAWGGVGQFDLSSNKGTCYKNSKKCECEDCGPASTFCKDYRCHDEDAETRRNSATQKWECYKTGTNEKVDEETYDFCYAGIGYCDLTACKKGQYLSGCMRASAGECRDCPIPETGKFWGPVGNGLASCTAGLRTCTVAKPGEYVKTACSNTADAVVQSCAKYPGNKKSQENLSQEQIKALGMGRKDVFDIDRYYCPVGNIVLPLPANSEASSDYTAYICKAGHYTENNACVPCPLGHACAFGQKFVCPANYYNKGLAATACTRCTSKCSGNRKPMRCSEGSIVDLGCVSCGACGFSSDSGLSCVENTYEIQQLKPTCAPSGNADARWNCRV